MHHTLSKLWSKAITETEPNGTTTLELIEAVVACARLQEQQASQHFIAEGKGLMGPQVYLMQY